jgi:DNA-binding transcriptional LysR family regulator
MDWDDLKIFLCVARSGQMTAASKTLKLDHSTISRRIVRLEGQMKVTLFDRAGKRLRITPDGVKLLGVAESIESLILREAVNIRADDQAIAGTVRIGTMEGFGACYLAARLPELLREHSDLEIELVALQRNFSLASREVDIAITMDRPAAGSVRFRKLVTATLAIYGTAAYFERYGEPKRTEDLREHLWCGFIPELIFTEEINFLKFEVPGMAPRFRTTSPIVQMEAMSAGEALGVMPCFMVRNRPELQRVMFDKTKIIKNYWLSVHEDLSNQLRVQYVKQRLEALVLRDRDLFMPQ